MDLPGYYVYWNSAQPKGYSGTMILSKRPALSVRRQMGDERFDHEGRVLTREFEDFFVVKVYTPNSKRELECLDEGMEFEDLLRKYLSKLSEEKPVALCGDLNVAPSPIDLKNPDTIALRRALPIKKESALAFYWKQVLSILFAIFIPILRTPFPGGAI